MAHRVRELVERRSANAKHWLRDDGLVEAEFHPGPIHYRAEDGSWQDCDPTIERKTRSVDGESYDRAATKLPHKVWFKRQAKAPLRLEAPGGHVLVLRAVGGNASTATISGNVATYPDAWPDTDWRRTVTRWGLKSDLLLKAPTAPATFAFRVATALTPESSPDGAIRWRDGDALVATFPTPTLTDAAGVSGPVTQRLTPDGADWLLTLEADRAWLDDPARVYPVTLDPTTTFNVAASGDDGEVLKRDTVYPPGGTAFVDTTAVRFIVRRQNASGTYTIGNGLIRWNTSSLPDDAVVTAATLRVYVETKYNDDARQLTADWYTAWPIDAADYSETAQTTAHAGTAIGSITFAADNDFALTGLTNVSLTGYTGLRLHISGGQPTGVNSVSILSYDDAGTGNEPRLLVTYSRPPTATPSSPTGTATAPATVTDEVTPRLAWTYADPENDAQTAYEVEVYDGAGVVYASGTVASANAYHDVPLSAGLKYGVTYGWRVRAKDAGSNTFGPWSAQTYVRCVLSAVTGLTATADAANAEIDLAWTAHSGEKLAGYRVYRKRSTESSFAKLQDLVTPTSYSDELAASGVSYDYRVAAVATDGYEGPQSSTASASVTITGFWVGNAQVKLREAVAYEYPRRASRRIATDSTWVVQDLGTLPRTARFALAFSTLAERDALLALFPKGQEFAYRDEDGEVFRGKVTGVLAEERLRVPGQYMGTLHVEATEVTV